MNKKTALILAQLREGGLVLADRGTGKTTALCMRACELADDGEPVIVVALSDTIAKQLQDVIDQMRGAGKGRKPKVTTAAAFKQQRGVAPVAKILVDEYFLAGLNPRTCFEAAVATPQFPIRYAGAVERG